jgi:hypothetical protein
MMTGAPRNASSTVVDLDDPAARDAAVAGHKAATLATLKAAGFRVPAGFVITADACGELTGHAELTGEMVSGAPLPAGLREQIAAALAEQDTGEELEAALALLRRRFPDPPATPRDCERALGLLVRKGYELELAHDAIRRHAGISEFD